MFLLLVLVGCAVKEASGVTTTNTDVLDLGDWVIKQEGTFLVFRYTAGTTDQRVAFNKNSYIDLSGTGKVIG